MSYLEHLRIPEVNGSYRIKQLIVEYFDSNERQVFQWFTSKKEELGGITPLYAMATGRAWKVLQLANAMERSKHESLRGPREKDGHQE